MTIPLLLTSFDKSTNGLQNSGKQLMQIKEVATHGLGAKDTETPDWYDLLDPIFQSLWTVLLNLAVKQRILTVEILTTQIAMGKAALPLAPKPHLLPLKNGHCTPKFWQGAQNFLARHS